MTYEHKFGAIYSGKTKVLEIYTCDDMRVARLVRTANASDALFAALQEAVAVYGRPGGPWNVPSDPGGWLMRARDAIALARASTGSVTPAGAQPDEARP